MSDTTESPPPAREACASAQGDELCVETAFDQRLEQLWIAPPNGLYEDWGTPEQRAG